MKILTERCSMFCDYSRYAPTAANTIKWTQLFQGIGYELLPSIINQQIQSQIQFANNQLQITNMPPLPNKRGIQFASVNDDMVIRILPDRVDVEVSRIESDDYMATMSEKFQVLQTLMESLLDELSGAKGTRLALFVDVVIPETKDDGFANFYFNENLGLCLDDRETCTEWMHRYNQRIRITVDNKAELCNCITLMENAALQFVKVFPGDPPVLKGLHIVSDINTIAENAEERFCDESIRHFYGKAQTVFFSIVEQINSKLADCEN